MPHPSRSYYIAIAEGARHHANSKTYSGSLLRPHKPFLSRMIERLHCTSALDVGTGKGTQWQWVDPADGLTMEQSWGFDVFKYDPCYPPYAKEPEGRFDMVLCTHTMALIPLRDLEWFTRRLFGFACKGVFIAEKIGERKKGEVADPDNRAINWDVGQWVRWLNAAARDWGAHLPEIVLSTRERLDRGTITTRHIWRYGVYAEAQEAMPRGTE